MQKRRTFLPVAAGFFLLSLLLIFLFRGPLAQGASGIIELITTPIQRSFKGAFGGVIYSNSSWQQLVEENRTLAAKFAKQQELQKEIKALRDQFETTTVPSHSLLPATVLSSRGFVPGVSMPEELILDKGKADGVRQGMVVIYKDNLIGKIVSVSDHLTKVELISNKNTSFAARTLTTDALGIVRGASNGTILLANVVLSDKLEKNDYVVTKGEQDESGGYPPNLVIGKIVAVDKKPSALFQTAEVQTLLDLPKLTTVFIMKK
jgi:rod shape-determining protein MreC